MFGRVILTFFVVLFSYTSFAEIKYNLYISIEGEKVKGKVELLSDKDDTISLITENLRIEKKINPSKIHLKKGVPLKFEYRLKVKNDYENFINSSFISLLGNWYPVPDKNVIYSFIALLPDGFEAISEAEKIVKVKNEKGVLFKFYFEHPLDKLHLIASKEYRVYKDKYKDKEIYVYFFERDYSLSKKYALATKEYIKEYESFLTKFPYKRFSIVENIFQTGYSMPTFTLVGDRLIRYPFMINQSLRHEILHQWFGNYVYIDFNRGNWAEGLTTYLSDHYFSEKKGEGWKYRKNTIIKFLSTTRYKKDFPVKQFEYKRDKLSEAVGYGKTMFIFHMLKKEISRDSFYKGLREIIKRYGFKNISWEEIEDTFENVSGKELKRFFSQWLERVGIPEIESNIDEPLLKRGKFEIKIHLKQKQRKVYSLNIPVFIETVFGEERRVLRFSSREKTFRILVDDEPLKITIDKNYDIFRRLKKEENIPVISYILLSNKLTIVADKDSLDKYEPVFNLFTGRDTKFLTPEEVSIKDLKADVIIIEKTNPVLKSLFAGVPVHDGGFYFSVYENPIDNTKFVAVVHSKTKKDTEISYYRLPHYGTYSYVYFENRNIKEKGQITSERGIVQVLRDLTKGVPVERALNLKEIVKRIENKKIIYVGERHDMFSHHIAQLNIIKAIYKKHKKLAIGMEMFQRKFQPVIDEFINGNISEREFLKKTEYFKRWGFDYNLYKPILDFARKNKIPVIALNVETEIIKKVSRGGLESLSEKELEKIPSEMDFSNIKYRDRLKEIFGFHKTGRNFEYFLQSQILWDETMAETIDKFLRKNPKYKIVVIAGNGHLKYGFGIPDRCYRRNGFDYAIILNEESLDKDIGDFILFPERLEAEDSVKLGVFIEEKNGRLKVSNVIKNSIAEKSGIKKGDVILSINGNKISSLSDLKVELFYLKEKKNNTVQILRGGKTLNLKLKL